MQSVFGSCMVAGLGHSHNGGAAVPGWMERGQIAFNLFSGSQKILWNYFLVYDNNFEAILVHKICFEASYFLGVCWIVIFAESEYSAEYTLLNPNILQNIRHCRIMKKICLIKRVFNAGSLLVLGRP